ncbi:MAG: secondary thiamine-phosphate synthase enzyme YjbQ [Desulfobacula sp.]|nr:secondary thiamine-phosphate synthase enzyme YjbQ [Desulfobacula sp.]MCK5349767.1 secondary thiamine-phosphate synthase enzyme YjbQ [Desulfobacula sp.]
MNTTKTFFNAITLHQNTGPGINDISFDVGQIIKTSQIKNGFAHITAIGSTGSVTTIEYEPGVIEDLKNAINRIAPPDNQYQHELAWHDGNGHSHVQAAIIGPSIVVPVRDNTARLGTWQQIVVINHDNHARKRIVEVTISGI